MDQESFLGSVPRRSGPQLSILLSPPSSESSSWGWLQKAKAKLYPLLQPRREDFRLSQSPVFLLGMVYGDPKSILEQPAVLISTMLRAETGLKTIDRAYPPDVSFVLLSFFCLGCSCFCLSL
jgi:hypothetical protein